MNASSNNADVAEHSIGCPGCGLHQDCGGIDGEGELFGCFINCGSCDKAKCQWTCLKKPIQFWERVAEVGGFPFRGLTRILAPDLLSLPMYVPQIHDGHARAVPFPEPIVFIPTFRLLRQKGANSYGPRISDPLALREEFRLQSGCSIILSSIGKDSHLERLWAFGEECDVGSALRDLNISAITTPNFSFFEDVPRSHTLWNRQRMCHMTEYFSNCGIGVILHIHALTRSDWKFWELVLSRHSNVKFVTHEFQTGGQKWNDGVAFLERVAAMQDSLNRPLHMVAIGGGQFAPVLARLFAQFTIVDSTPFMKTLKRQRLIPRAVRRPAWRRQRTDPGEFLDDLLFHNVVMYRRWMQTRIEGEKDRIGVGA